MALTAENLKFSYLQSEFADVHFEFHSNGQTVRVPAHKYILAITSPVFAAMFFGPKAMKEKDVVKIDDATESEFKEFLQLFYQQKFILKMENIRAIARLAIKYGILDELDRCAKIPKKDEDDIIWGYQLAISLNHRQLKQSSESQIQKCTSKIFKSAAFFRCNQIVLEHILHLEKMDCNEIDVFNGCIEWAKSSCRKNGLDANDPVNLRGALGKCFHLIRFGAMKSEEMDEILSNDIYEGLFSRKEISEILCAKSVENLTKRQKWFTHVPRSKYTFEWNSDNILKCVRFQSYSDRVNLEMQESTWFTSNEPLVLGGEIVCGSIYHRSSNDVEISSILSIIEYNARTISLDAENKILYEGTTKFTQFTKFYSSVNLPRPIFIHPNKIYEIRLKFVNDWSGFMHRNTWNTEVELGNNAIIKFHPNPSDSVNNRRGLVHQMQFNRIE